MKYIYNYFLTCNLLSQLILGLVNGNDDPSKLSPPPMYSSTNLNPNGHIPQNYYLTGDESLPNQSANNDTNHSEVWMMKSDGMGDMMTDGGLGYQSGYETSHMDHNGFTYYYPHDEYQPLSNDNYSMNVKNSLCMF